MKSKAVFLRYADSSVVCCVREKTVSPIHLAAIVCRNNRSKVCAVSRVLLPLQSALEHAESAAFVVSRAAARKS